MLHYTFEQNTVAETFRRGFGGGRTCPLLLYGLGRNTEAILRLCPEIAIAGVMGPDADGEVWHGKPVVSAERAAELKANIVIVARNAVVPIIYRRIAPLEEQGVRIFRVSGLPAAVQRRYENRDQPYWDETIETLRARIGTAQYISFDIFDTLLMRRVLHPENIFEKLERELPCAAGFRVARVQAQKRLGPAADIKTIYDAVRRELGWTNKQTQSAMEAEWQAELSTVSLRADMVALLRYAEERGKLVWLLSDMYWSETRLRELLARIGAETTAPLLVSCEIGCSKEDGSLFREYLRRSGAQPSKCLHIGDNRYADVEAAEREGLSSVRIYSGYNLLEESAAQGLFAYERTAPDALGGFVANRFNSPFALHETRGLLPVEDAYELGYDYIGPLIDCWLDWLACRLAEDGVTRMLFPARDGFLLARLYGLLRKDQPELPRGIYFKASRRAVSVASICGEADAWELADRPFHGTTREFFRRRFGVEAADEEPWESGSKRAAEVLERYMPDILKSAARERTSYLNYLASLGLPCDGICGFFDFVAGGTVQHYYEKLIGKTTQGYYFATMNLPNAFYDTDDIAALFGNITSYSDNPLAEGYLMLESVLTDPDTMLVRIAEDGTPTFDEGANAAWPTMKQIQDGIYNYVAERIRRRALPADLEAGLAIWRLLFNGSCVVPEALRAQFLHEDSYDGSAAEPCWQTGGIK